MKKEQYYAVQAASSAVFSNTGNVTYGAVTSISDITETTFTISPRNDSSYPFAAGLTYRWWVWF